MLIHREIGNSLCVVWLSTNQPLYVLFQTRQALSQGSKKDGPFKSRCTSFLYPNYARNRVPESKILFPQTDIFTPFAFAANGATVKRHMCWPAVCGPHIWAAGQHFQPSSIVLHISACFNFTKGRNIVTKYFSTFLFVYRYTQNTVQNGVSCVWSVNSTLQTVHTSALERSFLTRYTSYTSCLPRSELVGARPPESKSLTYVCYECLHKIRKERWKV